MDSRSSIGVYDKSAPHGKSAPLRYSESPLIGTRRYTNTKLQNKTKKRHSHYQLVNPQTYNYFSETEFYPDKYITGLFSARGNWNRITKTELKTTDKPIHFMYINGKYYLEKYHYGVHAELKNFISGSRKIVADKSSLIKELSKFPVGRKYILETYTINGLQIMNKPNQLQKYKYLFAGKPLTAKTYILKPVSGFSGANIHIITSYDELVTRMNNHIKKWSNIWRKGSDYYKEWVLQEYLSDPLLFKGQKKTASDNPGYKFHLRHYFIFRPGDKKSFFLKKGLMATGLKPYVKGDWNNKDIHDTHFHGREGEKFPAALNLSQVIMHKLYKQLYELYSIINKILKVNSKCYSESRNCFALFGADLMITNDYNIKILEFNDSPGLGYEDQEYVPDEKKSVIENIMDIIVDEYFPPKTQVVNSFSDEVVFVKYRLH
jgi:hypothetical protein